MKEALRTRIKTAHECMVGALLADLGSQVHWAGELSSSALSTATAVTALAVLGKPADAALIQGGLKWLAANRNADGGWGDTTRSKSNLSTTALVWAAFGAAQGDAQFTATVDAAERCLRAATGSLERLVPAIEARYGKDRTFSVPITMMLALAGRLGPNGWQLVRSLPFELAVLPRGLFGALRLPVVSYALPALIAIGQVIQFRSKRFHPLRAWTRRRTLEVLTSLQPANGGFLEAIPLTSFVTMSLAGMELGEHIVARRGSEFLRQSVRSDGSWPIDTNLCTWVSTLAIKAIRHSPLALTIERKTALRLWLLEQQHRVEHPYTGAAPGGWAWSHLPGGVPDADDTAGALVALHLLRDRAQTSSSESHTAAAAGIRWLLDLQNGDGGIPTFCRGWGTLPFDRSAPELTAHAMQAWQAWLPGLAHRDARRVKTALVRASAFLERSQRDDGGWIPLWFGNEHAPEEENPVYGTAQVLAALEGTNQAGVLRESMARGRKFLVANQNGDGGWGGAKGAPSTIEETSVALEALPAASTHEDDAAQRGAVWLVDAIEKQAYHTAAPVGLYFARLWYFERLYPLVFSASALGRLLSQRS